MNVTLTDYASRLLAAQDEPRVPVDPPRCFRHKRGTVSGLLDAWLAQGRSFTADDVLDKLDTSKNSVRKVMALRIKARKARVVKPGGNGAHDLCVWGPAERKEKT